MFDSRERQKNSKQSFIWQLLVIDKQTLNIKKKTTGYYTCRIKTATLLKTKLLIHKHQNSFQRHLRPCETNTFFHKFRF